MELKQAIKENTLALRQLITLLQSQHSAPAHNLESMIDFNMQKKQSVIENQVNISANIDIDSLDLKQIVALAVLFKGDFEQISQQHMEKIIAAIQGDNIEQLPQINALYMTLANLEPVTLLPNMAMHNLCIEVLANWTNLNGIAERCEYALSLIESKKITANQPKKTDPQILFSQAEQLILQLAKNGLRNEAVGILNQFNAKKLGQVSVENLPEVISIAKTLLNNQ
ncbi:hypothetical protein AB7179_01080 [Providencia manganoxydans]|uniref:hypothetical protein n=1 Tax=Providencia manganoxydans TaxID=2923283 RepID=UPI0032DBDDC7